MDELLKAIEELKRAYAKSGCLSVRLSMVGDKYFECQVLKNDGSVAKIPHKQTNGEWLRSLNDEEFVRETGKGGSYYGGYICELMDDYLDVQIDCTNRDCFQCKLAWLRAEHKEVE